MYSTNSHFFTNGGSEIHIKELSEALVRLGVDISVVCNSQYAKNEIITTDNGVEYNIVPSLSCRRRKTFVDEGVARLSTMISNKSMYERLIKIKADIFHQHDLISNYTNTLRLHSKGCRLILTNHLGEFLILKRYLPKKALRMFLKPYNVIIGPSKELTPHAFHPNTETIYNGFNPRIFNKNIETRKKIRNQLSVKTNEWLIVVARRWAPTKGVLFAARAARELTKIRNDIKWIFLCQNSPGFETYKRKIWNLLEDLSNVFIFDTQAPHRLAEFLNAADIALFPSILEAVSIAALEAMACGTSVMATNVGGMSEIVRDYETGLLLPNHEHKEIVKAINTITSQPEVIFKVARNAEDFVEREFYWDSIAKQTLSLYESAVLN